MSLFRRAITAPRIRKALGSPMGLIPTQVTVVFSITPKSCKRRVTLPSGMTFRTRALSPGIKLPSVRIKTTSYFGLDISDSFYEGLLIS